MRVVLNVASEGIRSLLQRRGLRTYMLACTILTLVLGIAAAAARNYLEDASDSVSELETQQDQSHSSGTGSDADAEEQTGDGRTLLRASQNVIIWYVGATMLLGIMATLYIGATGVRRDMGTGAAEEAVSGSVTRGQYLLGKYLAAMTVGLGFWLLMGAEIALFMRLFDADGTPANWHFQLVYLLCVGLLTGSMAFMLSVYAPPFIAGSIALFCDGELIREGFSDSNPLYYLHFLLPDGGLFDISELNEIAAFTQGSDVLLRVLYALDFAVILFLLALLRFRSVDFKLFKRDHEWRLDQAPQERTDSIPVPQYDAASMKQREGR